MKLVALVPLRALRLLSWALLLVIVGTPLTARAQPMADEVYADAKEIIAELIERDVAESMATNLACYSRGGLLKYFPETLQAAYERNFGALKDVLRAETIKLAGHYAFESFRQRRSIPLREFLPISRFDPANRDETCVTEVARLGGPSGYYEQQQQEVRGRNEGNYLPMDVCARPAGPTKADELPCLFAQAVVSSAAGRRSDTEEALSVAVGTAVAQVLAEYQPADFNDTPLKSALIEEIRYRFSNGKFSASGPLAIYTSSRLNESLDLAKTAFVNIWREPSASHRIRAGALRMLLKPADSPIATIHDGAATRLSELLPLLRALPRSSLTSLPGEPASVAVARAVLMQASIVPAGPVDVTELDGGVQMRFNAQSSAPVAFVGAGLLRLVDLYEMVQTANELQRLLGLVKASPEPDPQHEAALRGIIGLVQAIDALGGTLSTAGKTADGGFDLLTLLDSVVRSCAASKSQSVGARATPVMDLKMCAIWRQAAGLLDPEGNLRPIVSAARERNYRSLAVAAVSAIFSTAATEELCCGEGPSCYASVELYGRLAKSITSYVLMPRDDQDASLAARAAFKSAAVDVIREIGKRGGVERPFRPPFINQYSFLLPTLSLRASWSGSYRVIDPGQDSVRFVPTVDFPTIRVAVTKTGSPVYVAAVLNLTDVLAPLTELVTRDAKFDYSDEWPHWAASVVHPRLSATFAFPSLTKNTAVTIGIGMRGSAAFLGKKNDADDMPIDTYGYRTLFQTQSDDVTFARRNGVFERLFEASVGVQYVP